jgi:hypothetical protein
MKKDSFSSPLLARFCFRPIVRKSSFSPQTPPHPLSASRVLWLRPSSAQALARSWPGCEPARTHQGPGHASVHGGHGTPPPPPPRACAPWTAAVAPYKVARQATANPSRLRIALLAPPPNQAEPRAAGQCAAAAVLRPPSNSGRSRTAPPLVSRSTRPPWSHLSIPCLIDACRPPERCSHRGVRPPLSSRGRPPLCEIWLPPSTFHLGDHIHALLFGSFSGSPPHRQL